MRADYVWEETYHAAILETDNSKLAHQIRAAKGAIDTRLQELQMDHGGTAEERQAITDAHKSLLPKDDMERILRYEERMHRQIDWAVQRLLECQERRKTLQPTPNVELATTRESAKRSQ